MTNWAIVAIPEEDDHVWKISSEKVPHMTLLNLGEQPATAPADKVAEFLEHAAKTSLTRFGLSVDRRGTLGPDEADVLFFDKGHMAKDLNLFRSFLVTDDNISKMYHSTEQYPEWTPHLTLGYPATPAKEDDRDYPIPWVGFDRVALWNGDYTGPEFVLPQHDSVEAPVEMSDVEKLEKILAHYGIRGMKWGVRRPVGDDGRVEKSSSEGHPSDSHAKAAPGSADHERAAKAYAKAQEKGLHSLSNEELKAITNRVKAEKEFQNLSSDQKSELQKKVEQLRLEKEFRTLSAEKAKATRSTGRKVVDALLDGVQKTVMDKAAEQGADLVKQMMGQMSTKKASTPSTGKTARKGPFKVNPAKVTFKPGKPPKRAAQLLNRP